MNRIEWVRSAVTAANTARDGTGAVSVVFSADEATWVEKVRFTAVGTNIQTVARLFINNGDPNATAANNVLIAEVTLPATTASADTAITAVESTLRLYVPEGYRILLTLGTAVASGYYVTAFAGDYWREQAQV